MNDLIARLTSLKSTVLAVITGLLTVAVAVGVVSDEALTQGITATGNLYEAIIVALGSIGTIVALLAKKGDA
jgi:hypothetical protein